jgi:hypothetical protein
MDGILSGYTMRLLYVIQDVLNSGRMQCCNAVGWFTKSNSKWHFCCVPCELVVSMEL